MSQGVSTSTSAPRPPPNTPGRHGGENIAAHKSIHATPSKVSAQKKIRDKGGLPNSEQHSRFIQAEYQDKVDWEFDPEEFIKAVFHFAWEDVFPTPYGETGSYELSASKAKDFLESANETATYEPLCRLTNGLLRQLYGPLDDGPTAIRRRKQVAAHRVGTGKSTRPVRTYQGRLRTRACEALSHHGLKEKPDLTYGVDEGTKPVWEWELLPVEVAKTRNLSAKDLSDILISGKNGIFTVLHNPGIQDSSRGEGVDVEEKDSDMPPPPHRRASAGHSRQSAGGSSGHRVQGVSGTGSSAGKRKRSNADPAMNAASSGSKRARMEGGTNESRGITKKEAQVLKYIVEIMSHNLRSYAVGWLIENESLRLVYGDRMGIVFTKAIDFLGKDANLFLLIVAAMGAAGVHDLGIHPNVCYPRIVDGVRPYAHKDAPVDIFDRERRYKDAKLRLEGQGEDGSRVLEFDFDIDDAKNRVVYTEVCLVGRATAAPPIKATPGTVQMDERFSGDLIAKISWPHAARTGEDTFIHIIRSRPKAKGKKKILDHIVDLKAAVTKDMEAMGLPRHEMGLKPDLRVCRILILKRYQPLDAIGSQARFHKVFVQAVRAHYWVYETSSVLHRDISTNNIMWLAREQEVIGVLCDWDLTEDQSNTRRPPVVESRLEDSAVPSVNLKGKSASLRRSERLASRPSSRTQDPAPQRSVDSKVKARYRTGTGPFMALDLLRKHNPPVHKYRHDLESFFYVYTCTAATYNPDEKQIRVIREWDLDALVAIGHNKLRFLTEKDEFNEVFQNAHGQFKSVIEDTLRVMWSMFSDVEDLAYQCRRIQARTVENAEKAVLKLEDQRDGMATYERFMSILGEPLDVPEN